MEVSLPAVSGYFDWRIQSVGGHQRDPLLPEQHFYCGGIQPDVGRSAGHRHGRHQSCVRDCGHGVIDKLGRKTLLLIGAAGTAGCLAGVAWIFKTQFASGGAGVAAGYLYRVLLDVAGRGDLGLHRRGLSQFSALKGPGRGQRQPLDHEHDHRAGFPVVAH